MSSEKRETAKEREAIIAQLEPIERLQKAALELVKRIDKDLRQGEAPEGIFRVSASKEKMDQQMKIIKATGAADLENLTQIERAALLKTVFRELRDQQAPLSNDVNSMTSDSLINQLIASKLFQLFNRLISDTFVHKTKMDANNLSIAIAPSLFPETIVQNENPLQAAQRGIAESKHAATILIPLMNEPPKELGIKLHSTHYQYAVNDAQHSRKHSKEVDGASEKFKGLKAELQGFKGDLLKSQILEQFKRELEGMKTPAAIDKWLADKKANSAEYKVLATGQDFMTRTFHLETSSIKALNEMVAEQKRHINILGEDEPSSPQPGV